MVVAFLYGPILPHRNHFLVGLWWATDAALPWYWLNVTSWATGFVVFGCSLPSLTILCLNKGHLHNPKNAYRSNRKFFLLKLFPFYIKKNFFNKGTFNEGPDSRMLYLSKIGPGNIREKYRKKGKKVKI